MGDPSRDHTPHQDTLATMASPPVDWYLRVVHQRNCQPSGLIRWIVCLVAIGCGSSASLAESPPRFVERPGVLEYSGRMIVRPLQPEALRARGLSDDAIDDARRRARSRLAPDTIDYVPETDEYIIALDVGVTEHDRAGVLLATGDYEYAVPDWICHPTETVPNDQSFQSQWHHATLRSTLAWDTDTGRDHVVIAIVDGGVQLDHPDLIDVLVPGYNAPSRLAQVDGGEVGDVDGHGTFVAGLAGATGNNRRHVTGMGWDFSIMPVRYYDSPGGGFLSDILDGARWASEQGASVINVSQTGVEFAPVQVTGEYVRAQGGMLVWAAGNDARDLDFFDWEDVTIVGATDIDDQRPSWSAFGRAVDLFAPGDDMLSTGLPGGLAIGSGTSAAAPLVSGVAGLIFSAHPNLSPRQVEQMILTSCVDLGPPGEDDAWGHGKLDAASAVVCPTDLVPPFGTHDFFDIVAYLEWFSGGEPVADWNADGRIDVFDLLRFLEDFDRCR